MSEPPLNPPPRKSFKSPLAALAASFALGILASHSLPIQTTVPWSPAIAAACLLAGLILLRAGWDRVAVGFVLAAMTFIGMADTWRWERRFPVNDVRYVESAGVDLNHTVKLEGRVISTPYRTGYGLQFDVEALQIQSIGRVHATYRKDSTAGARAGNVDPATGARLHEFDYGDTIRTNVRIRQPHIYQNPGISTFVNGLRISKTSTRWARFASVEMVEITSRANAFSPTGFVEHVRQRLLQ